MSAIIGFSIRLDNLPKEKMVKTEDGKIFYNFTLTVNDETRYGNNVSGYDSQTKEEREAKQKRNYIGNGKVLWTDGKIAVADKEETSSQPVAKAASIDDGLPF